MDKKKMLKIGGIVLLVLLILWIIRIIFVSFFHVFYIPIKVEDNLFELKFEDDKTLLKSLDVDLLVSEVNIKSGEEFKVETNNKNIKLVKLDEYVDIYDIKPRRGNRKTVVNITLPNKLERIEAKVDAGELNLDKIDAETISAEIEAGNFDFNGIHADKGYLELDAGNINFENTKFDKLSLEHSTGEINIKKSELKGYLIDQSAGKINIKQSILTDGRIEHAAGKFTMDGKLLEKAYFDLGIGDAKINIDEKESFYSMTLDKGLGDFKLNGKKEDKDYYLDNESSNDIFIKQGVGSLSINFK